MTERTWQFVLLFGVIVLHALALIALLRGDGTRQHKINWSLMILLLPFLGVITYVMWGHGPRDAHLPP
ncbi:MAG: PLDc N-terminal domain-containing protein [Planctomycetaceae bacterium]|nr:PLDc N-terminal domain-containing protein [Planctomycetaceae bacterium]